MLVKKMEVFGDGWFISEENLQKKKIIDSQLKINELNETVKSLNKKLFL